MKKHEGPLNLNAVSTWNPDDLFREVIKILAQFGGTVKPKGRFEAQIEF